MSNYFMYKEYSKDIPDHIFKEERIMSTVSTKTDVNSTAAAYDVAETQTQKKTKVTGKTIGKPELSEKAAKYYEDLKKKYSNMDFILVSKDMKEQAKAQAGSYANANSMVVLIDEDKIERMAEDEEYRKKYESIIGNAASNLSQLKNSLGSNSGVKAYGVQINDNGTASYFAVVDKSLSAQKERIEKKAAEKKEAKKADEKKRAKEEYEEKLKEKREVKSKDSVTVTASSAEELIKKIEDLKYASLSDRVQTQQEQMVGQHIDFKG